MTQNNRTFEALRFAVQLTNRGKPTSLTSWKAHLTLDDGRVFSREVQYLDKDGAEIEDANHNKIIYAIPECDLTVETVRAMQTGDSVFGIIAFGFFDLPSGPVPLNTKVTLQATDMLGRTIKSQEIQFAEVNKNPRDVFPCPVK